MHDAVMVVPGIMGSALRDVEKDTPLWGVGRLFQYSARTHQKRLRALAVSAEERAGETGRVEATGLLRIADWFPGLGTAQPYDRLVSSLEKRALDPAAVRAFPYDWRLAVEHNGRLLAAAAQDHLRAWRAHPRHRRHLADHPEDTPARLVFVAHSMGGLLTREVIHLGTLGDDVRTVMTIGTPFSGSVKAAVMLNSGRGAPLALPPRVLREVTPTMPGLYDLLPAYRCLEEGGDMRLPGPADIEALGGLPGPARTSSEWRERRQGIRLPGHVSVVGTGQRTWQSYRVDGGAAVPARHMFRRDRDDRLVLDSDGRPLAEDRGGDGTVYEFAAHLPGTGAEPGYAWQEHSALARSSTVIDLACGLLRGLRHRDDLGTMLGDGQYAVHTPEWVVEGASFTIEVTGAPPGADLECTVREVTGLDDVLAPSLTPSPGTRDVWSGECRPDRPGLYEVEVVGGEEPFRRLVAVVAAEGDG
ncbi:esterase/lipase family protein [Streptomyces sp. NPDC094466]|uniref:esterase/lipase family protein n=1 Tax=Streptomyces sp. NPDC094466 TaxID=3366065 RepID=UPI0037FDD6C5